MAGSSLRISLDANIQKFAEQAAYQVMEEKGAIAAMMSGSGPTVFALAKNQETAESIIAALADFDVETAITTTVGRIQ